MAYVLESLPEQPAGKGFVLESLPERPSTADDLKRGSGLGARATIKGLLAIPHMALDAGVAVGNLINKGTNALGLTDAAPFPSASELTDAALTKLGLAAPETPGERIASDVQGAATGAGVLASVSHALAGKVAPGVEKAVLEILAKLPGVQVASGAASGGASGVARESGASPGVQLAAGVAGGVAVPAAYAAAAETLRSLSRAAAQAHKPFTEGGRQDIVGAALRRVASDPDGTAARLADEPEIVPGSLPTTAQVSRDTGLLRAERTLAGTTPRFAERQSGNNAARNRVLDQVAGTDDALTAAKEAREASGKQLYAEAFNAPLRADAPLDKLVSLTKRPAMQEAIKKAAKIASENGDDQLDILLDPRGLHYIKLALDDTLDTAPQSGIGKAQQRAIATTRQDFVAWLEDASPAYAKAKAAYVEASKPVNQMEAGQSIRQATRLAGPDVTGEPIISQAKWQNVVTNKMDELSKVLTPEQLKSMQAIGADLDRGVLSASAGRAAGSDTFQNMSTANIIGAAIGGKAANNPILQTAFRPAQWLYRLPEQRVQELFVEAMLDPNLARALMARASRSQVDYTLAALKDKAKLMGLLSATGGTTGAATATSRQE